MTQSFKEVLKENKDLREQNARLIAAELGRSEETVKKQRSEIERLFEIIRWHVNPKSTRFPFRISSDQVDPEIPERRRYEGNSEKAAY